MVRTVVPFPLSTEGEGGTVVLSRAKERGNCLNAGQTSVTRVGGARMGDFHGEFPRDM